MYSSQMEQTRQFLPGFDRRQRLCLMCPGRYEYEQPIERNEVILLYTVIQNS